MKITNLNTGFRDNNQYGKKAGVSEPAPKYTPAYRKASGGEDFLEISDEAVKRHREARILSFEDGRRRKEAMNSEISADNTNLPDMAKAGRIKDMVINNKYDFNDAEILAETAERVIGFFR
ncbi:MAG TPA: hypothetical protein PKG60_11885 [Spirochaetota bacterium]|nr:hypothetical protein [Spirochaetota bacterium]HPS87168.1 hypothetical protein [Spirochaetota bacterium]